MAGPDENRTQPGIEPFVTVLTPVYNGEKFLDQCIESVLRQSYGNWEYVIVDNCSNDRTAEIACSYARRDARIRLVRNERFVGVNQNHNIAFRQISPDSRYCKVVHADDWLFPECLREMVQLAEQHPSVGIVGAYRLDGVRVNLDGLAFPISVVPGREICRNTLYRTYYVFGSPTSLLVRADAIRARSEFYPESNPHADTESCYAVLRDWDFGFVHQVLTYTRRHGEAESSRSQRLNTYLFSELRILTTYGPALLTAQEYDQLFKKKLNEYYSFLASRALHRKGKDFWEFHENGLRELGFPLRRGRLARKLASQMLDRLLNPKLTIERILQARRVNGNPRHS